MKTHRLSLIFTLFILVTPSLALGITGNDWKKLSETGQLSYVAGVTEGWNIAAVIEEDKLKTKDAMSHLVSCFARGMTVLQITSMVEKYMKEHPEQWHHEMSVIVFFTMTDACKDHK